MNGHVIFHKMGPPIQPCQHPSGVLTQNMIIPAANNLGFVLVAFENMRVDGKEFEPIIICTECRFSDPAMETLSKAKIEEKRDLADQFRSYLNNGVQLDGLSIKRENLFLVACAFREVNNNVLTDLPSNTLVLDRNKLKDLYSPSLASRPQFILPLKEGESTRIQE